MDSRQAADPPRLLRKGHKRMGTTKDIREAVNAELKFDPLVDDADIHVVNLNGDVALNGTVPNYPQYLEAAADTLRGRGRLEVLRIVRYGAVERDVPVEVHDVNVRVVDQRVELELRVDCLADVLG